MMLGLAVTAQPFIRVVLGPRWMPVAGLLIVFAPLGAAQSIYTTVGLIYYTQGRPDLQFRWQMFAGVMYVGSFAAGLRWGIQGVATCYALVWLLLMVPSFMIPFRVVDLSGKQFLRTLWPTIWMSLAMAAVTEAWLKGCAGLVFGSPGSVDQYCNARRSSLFNACVGIQATRGFGVGCHSEGLVSPGVTEDWSYLPS